ncbi:MAG: PDGLE domain-containing protein [Dehalococcoidia bacterium]|nr:PDGLE domain-containing protein [Dehalococcoidia bacterium]
MKLQWLKWWHIALGIALLFALLSPLASGSPDGLEKVAEDKGFIDKATEPPFQIIADYLFPGIHNEALATILAGIIGTVAIFAIVYAVAWLLRRRQAVKNQ